MLKQLISNYPLMPCYTPNTTFNCVNTVKHVKHILCFDDWSGHYFHLPCRPFRGQNHLRWSPVPHLAHLESRTQNQKPEFSNLLGDSLQDILYLLKKITEEEFFTLQFENCYLSENITSDFICRSGLDCCCFLLFSSNSRASVKPPWYSKCLLFFN